MDEKGDEVYCETSLAAPNRAQFTGTVTSTLIWASLCRFYALANSGLSLLLLICLTFMVRKRRIPYFRMLRHPPRDQIHGCRLKRVAE
jgi:hypothetical protein